MSISPRQISGSARRSHADSQPRGAPVGEASPASTDRQSSTMLVDEWQYGLLLTRLKEIETIGEDIWKKRIDALERQNQELTDYVASLSEQNQQLAVRCEELAKQLVLSVKEECERSASTQWMEAQSTRTAQERQQLRACLTKELEAVERHGAGKAPIRSESAGSAPINTDGDGVVVPTAIRTILKLRRALVEEKKKNLEHEEVRSFVAQKLIEPVEVAAAVREAAKHGKEVDPKVLAKKQSIDVKLIRVCCKLLKGDLRAAPSEELKKLNESVEEIRIQLEGAGARSMSAEEQQSLNPMLEYEGPIGVKSVRQRSVDSLDDGSSRVVRLEDDIKTLKEQLQTLVEAQKEERARVGAVGGDARYNGKSAEKSPRVVPPSERRMNTVAGSSPQGTSGTTAGARMSSPETFVTPAKAAVDELYTEYFTNYRSLQRQQLLQPHLLPPQRSEQRVDSDAGSQPVQQGHPSRMAPRASGPPNLVTSPPRDSNTQEAYLASVQRGNYYGGPAGRSISTSLISPAL